VTHMFGWHPPVGVYIAVLGLLGVLVPLFRDLGRIGRKERAIWTFLVFGLVLLEIKSIYQDRSEHDAQQRQERQEQLDRFKEISDGLSAAINKSEDQFQKTMDQTRTLIDSSTHIARMAKQSVDELTGGDSYAVVTPILYPLESRPEFRLTLYVRGRYPISDADIELTKLPDVEFGTRRQLEELLQGKPTNTVPIFKGKVEPTRAQFLPQTIVGSTTSVTEYIITVNARNGETVENLKVRWDESNSRWEYKVEVGRLVPTKPPLPSQSKKLLSSPWTHLEIHLNPSQP
jgi:hypothetical protein